MCVESTKHELNVHCVQNNLHFEQIHVHFVQIHETVPIGFTANSSNRDPLLKMCTVNIVAAVR